MSPILAGQGRTGEGVHSHIVESSLGSGGGGVGVDGVVSHVLSPPRDQVVKDSGGCHWTETMSR